MCLAVKAHAIIRECVTKLHKSVNMLSGSITKGLLALSIPIMIMNVMQSMFSVIDMTILGKLANDNAVGAVGACGMLIGLITGFFMSCLKLKNLFCL